MQQPSLDFPPEVPSYVTKRQLGRYIEQLAATYGLGDRTVFGATVSSVSPVSTAAAANGSGAVANPGQGGWRVGWTSARASTADGGGGTGGKGEESRHFDAIVVATGHYHEP